MEHYSYKNLPTSIQTVDEVSHFARYLSGELHLSFHPDDPFVDYLDDKELVEKLDALMTSALTSAKQPTSTSTASWAGPMKSLTTK